MNNKSYRDYAGNRFNLRAKTINQIRRSEAISSNMGALGDFLVTTWGGWLFAMGVLGIGGMIIVSVAGKSGFAMIIPDILPLILGVIGLILIALNALFTNPVQGSQLGVSLKFIYHKFNDISRTKKSLGFRAFRFWPGDEFHRVIEQADGGNRWYITAYTVRGIISPVTFDSEREFAAQANSNLLQNIEDDTVLATVVSIGATTVHKSPVPKGASPAMIKKRDMLFRVTDERPHNQQIQTIITIATPNPDLLRTRTQQIEASFQQGMVVGYSRLEGKNLKDRIKDIFGGE